MTKQVGLLRYQTPEREREREREREKESENESERERERERETIRDKQSQKGCYDLVMYTICVDYEIG